MNIKIPHTDSIGRSHTRRCWERCEFSLMDELMLQGGIDQNIVYLDDDATDYRIPEWNTTQQTVVSDWLSDGTVSCTCDDE
jgi:hypothetical protein